MYLAGAESQCRSHRVDGHIATTDDADPLATEIRGLVQSDVLQELGSRIDAREVFALDAQPPALVGANGQHDGLVALPIQQTVSGEVAPQSHVGLDLHISPADIINLDVQHISRQAVVWDSHGHHAAGDRQFLEHGHGIALLGQPKGRR